MKKIMILILLNLILASCIKNTNNSPIYRVGTNEYGRELCVQKIDGGYSEPFLCPRGGE